MVEPDVADVRVHVAVRRVRGRDPATGAVGLVQIAPGHRSLQRRVGAAVVEVSSAEVVVGVPGVGGELQKDPVGRIDRRPYDEEGVALADLAVDIDAEQDLVEARGPVVAHGHRVRSRPAAAVGRCVVGSRVVVGRDAVAPDDGAFGSDPGDLDGHRSSACGGQVQGHRSAGGDRLGPAVSIDGLECHRGILARERPAP